jgi:hypothetical protein
MIRFLPPVEVNGYIDLKIEWVDKGEVTGGVTLSFAHGECLGHDMWSNSTDKHAALKIWRAATKVLDDVGIGTVNITIRDGDPLEEFWKRRGFAPQFTMYRGDIHGR